MRHARKPARVAEEDSETPYMTRRAMEFMAAGRRRPWCLHLSYIKPHWPYIAPAPYNAMYGPADVLPAVRSRGRARATRTRSIASSWTCASAAPSRATRCGDEVIPVYMGLIKQIDDQMGVLFALPARSAGCSTTP